MLEGMFPFLGSVQVLDFERKNLYFSNSAVTTSAAARRPISRDELDSIFNMKEIA